MTEERYAVGRNGVFATLYDTVERRLILDNATEINCLRARADLLAGRGFDATGGKDPDDCRHCGLPSDGHGRRFSSGVGLHRRVAPWPEQRLARRIRRYGCNCYPHGPDEPCTCDGCWACKGHEAGCTCDINWDCTAGDPCPDHWKARNEAG